MARTTRTVAFTQVLTRLQHRSNLRDAMHVFIILTATLILAACGSTRDGALEERLKKALLLRKTEQSTSLDLSQFVAAPLRGVCIQGPYLEEDDFEKLVGEDAPGFEYLGGRGNALWLYYADGSVAWVLIDADTMGVFPKKGRPCVAGDARPELRFAFDGAIKKFYLLGA